MNAVGVDPISHLFSTKARYAHNPDRASRRVGTAVAAFRENSPEGCKLRPHDSTLDRLIREAEEARQQEAVLVADGEELLDRARSLAQTLQERVTDLTEPPE